MIPIPLLLALGGAGIGAATQLRHPNRMLKPALLGAGLGAGASLIPGVTPAISSLLGIAPAAKVVTGAPIASELGAGISFLPAAETKPLLGAGISFLPQGPILKGGLPKAGGSLAEFLGSDTFNAMMLALGAANPILAASMAREERYPPPPAATVGRGVQIQVPNIYGRRTGFRPLLGA